MTDLTILAIITAIAFSALASFVAWFSITTIEDIKMLKRQLNRSDLGDKLRRQALAFDSRHGTNWSQDNEPVPESSGSAACAGMTASND